MFPIDLLSARGKVEPRFKACHAFRYRSRIPSGSVELFHEALSEWAEKEEPSPNDRAKQIIYKIPTIGKVALSKARGTVIVDTNVPDPFKRLKTYIGKSLYNSLLHNKMQTSVGVHIPKTAIKPNQTITTKIHLSPEVQIPLTVTVSKTSDYIDVHVHIKMPHSPTTPRGYPNDSLESRHPRRYVRDVEILDYVRKKGFIMTMDAKNFGLKRKSLGYRLKNLTEQGYLKKVGKSPATYYPL